MKQEIIEMARQAKLDKELADDYCRVEYWTATEDELVAFAKLVAAKEREAFKPRLWTKEMNDAWHKAIPDVMLAFDELIRARGEA
jgi:hypothetical protein